MEPEFIELIRNARKRKVGKFRTQLSIFVICLGISIFLWILVHLSKDYLYTAEYQLNYTQIPWNMRMLSCSDSTLNLTIRLQGYEFFSERFFRRKQRECKVSLRGMKMKFSEDQVEAFILSRGIAKNISEQSTYPLEIVSTSPDTIYFSFERRIIKRMNINKLPIVRMLPSRIDSSTVKTDSLLNYQKPGVNLKENGKLKKGNR